MKTKMTTSEIGKRMIIHFEGLQTQAYQDSAGYLTIGVGHLLTVMELKTGMLRLEFTDGSGAEVMNWKQGLNERQVIRLLEQDLKQAEAVVHRQVKVDLTQSQFDALVSWVFNLGEGNLKKSMLLKKINRGEFEQMPSEILKWNKAKNGNGEMVEIAGLVRRRIAEAELWQTGQWG